MNARFANPWSRWLLKSQFANQFYIPFPPTRLERLALAGLEKILERPFIRQIQIDRPIFIVGLPRSGTSMLYDLLCAHEESAYISHLMVKYHATPLAAEWIRRTLRLGVEGSRFLNDSVLVRMDSAAEPFTHWGKWFGRDIESLYWERKTRSDLGERKVQEIRHDLQKIIAAHDLRGTSARRGLPPARRFVCKFATVQPEIELLQELFPDARFVNIIRDGRAVAHSMLKLHRTSNDQLSRIAHPLLRTIIPYPRVRRLGEYVDRFGADSIECTSHVWKDAMALVEDIKPRLTHYFEFRYEDLLTDPEYWMRKVFSFCQLSWPSTPEFEILFRKIGHLEHSNRYPNGRVVDSICRETLATYGYV